MTLDEAANILNVKKPSEAFKEGSSELQQMLKVHIGSSLYSFIVTVEILTMGFTPQKKEL